LSYRGGRLGMMNHPTEKMKPDFPRKRSGIEFFTNMNQSFSTILIRKLFTRRFGLYKNYLSLRPPHRITGPVLAQPVAPLRCPRAFPQWPAEFFPSIGPSCHRPQL